jgi:hypothetical protein
VSSRQTGHVQAHIRPRYSIPTPAGPFSSARTAMPKFPEVSGLDQHDAVDLCRPLPSRDNAMAGDPTYKPPSVRDRDGLRDLRQHRQLPCHCRPPGLFHQFHRWRPRRVGPKKDQTGCSCPSSASDDSGRMRTRARHKRGPNGPQMRSRAGALNDQQVIEIYTTWDRAADAALRYGVKLSIIHSVRNSSA